MEGLITKSSRAVGVAALSLLALTMIAGCGPNKDVEAAQSAAQQADTSATRAEAASKQAQDAAASAQASASKVEQSASEAKDAADRAEAIAAKTDTGGGEVHHHRHW